MPEGTCGKCREIADLDSFFFYLVAGEDEVLLEEPRDLGPVGPQPEGLLHEGLEVDHLVDVLLADVLLSALADHGLDLPVDLVLHLGVRGQGVQVEQDGRGRSAQAVGEQGQADDGNVLDTGSKRN